MAVVVAGQSVALFALCPTGTGPTVKITQYGDGICSRDGEACRCSDPKHPIAISEENASFPSTDSARFLTSGACRAFWVRTFRAGFHACAFHSPPKQTLFQRPTSLLPE